MQYFSHTVADDGETEFKWMGALTLNYENVNTLRSANYPGGCVWQRWKLNAARMDRRRHLDLSFNRRILSVVPILYVSTFSMMIIIENSLKQICYLWYASRTTLSMNESE